MPIKTHWSLVGIMLARVMTVCIAIHASAQLHLPPQGYRSTVLSVEGKSVTCSSAGKPVTWVANYGLTDVGFTKASQLVFAGLSSLEIQYNPKTLLSMPGDLQLFWLGHECGHAYQQTTDEDAADCWSAKTGVKQGWFTLADFAQLSADMQNNPGDSTHAPGSERIVHIQKCMGQPDSNSNQFCPTLQNYIQQASKEFISLRGERKKPKPELTNDRWEASDVLPGAHQCTVWGRDQLLSAKVGCLYTKDSTETVDSLETKVEFCVKDLGFSSKKDAKGNFSFAVQDDADSKPTIDVRDTGDNILSVAVNEAEATWEAWSKNH
jgi:hypothetical protein